MIESHNIIDKDKLCNKLSISAAQTVSFFESKLDNNDSYGTDAKDIACYFKSPMMFLAAKKLEKALLLLKYIKKSFMSDTGDFFTNKNTKSLNPAYSEFWTYTNGWIVRAANKLRVNEISVAGHQYLSQYNLGLNGCITNNINDKTEVVDVLTTAHHGLINLEMGNLDVSQLAGDYLCHVIEIQPDLKNIFYLRTNRESKLLTDFSSEQKYFYAISTKEPNQLYFMIGYPAAYLALLYKKTQNQKYLRAAQSYLNFALSCHDYIYQCDFSHKIAWAVSIMYRCTGNNKYLHVIDRISNYFIATQNNGMWFTHEMNVSYDQSAEIAYWFLEIANNISNGKR